jgi:molybdopterin-binding protein
MNVTGAIARGLLITMCVGGLVACGHDSEPPAPNATAGFCVGVDGAHPAQARATVTFTRGDQILGTVSNVVTGPVSVPVTPGEVSVYVDDTSAASLSVSAGGQVYATSGVGCPATLPR